MHSHMTSKNVSKRQIWALPPAHAVLESQGRRHVTPLLLCLFHLPPANASLEDAATGAPFPQLPPYPKNSFVGSLRTNVQFWENDMALQDNTQEAKTLYVKSHKPERKKQDERG